MNNEMVLAVDVVDENVIAQDEMIPFDEHDNRIALSFDLPTNHVQPAESLTQLGQQLLDNVNQANNNTSLARKPTNAPSRPQSSPSTRARSNRSRRSGNGKGLLSQISESLSSMFSETETRTITVNMDNQSESRSNTRSSTHSRASSSSRGQSHTITVERTVKRPFFSFD